MVDRHDDHTLPLIKGTMAASLQQAGRALLGQPLPPLAGPDRDALRSVVNAVCDELRHGKQRLDHFVQSDRQNLHELDSLLPALRQVADTLAVLGFHQPRKVIIDQVSVIHGLIQGQRAPDDAVLMDVAGALLYVEATLAGMLGASEAGEREEGGGEASAPDMTQIHRVVLIESRACLQEALDLIDDCLDGVISAEASAPGEAVPELLNQVRGALQMIGLQRAAELLRTCRDHVLEHWPTAAGLAADPQVEALASALTAIDFYLGRRVDDPQRAGDTALAVAEENLERLRQPLPVQPTPGVDAAIDGNLGAVFLEQTPELPAMAEARLPAALLEPGVAGDFDADGFDRQLLEIFRNEALTHLATLESFLRLAAQQGPLPASDALQRAVHTLKGSAWMAGVLPIAALATAMDRMVREFKSHRWPLGAAQTVLLRKVLEAFKASVQRLPADPLRDIDGAEVLIGEFIQQVAERLEGAADENLPVAAPKRDPQQVTRFLEQGMDILLDAENLLDHWHQHPAQRQDLTALLDELTALGQSAHLADLEAVDELCEALLDLYGAVEESSLAVTEAFFAEAHQAHDALINMLDQLAAGQDIEPQPERLKALRDLLDGALDPAATGLVQAGGTQVTELASAIQAAEPDSLAQLFIDEAWDILHSADEALQRWLAAPANLAPLASLRHDLESLEGGAQMAEVGPISALVEALLALYLGLEDKRLHSDQHLGALLGEAHGALATLLRQYQAGDALRAPDALLHALGEWRRAASAAEASRTSAAPPAPQASHDQELLDIFLEEAGDIVESTNVALTRWRGEPRNGLEVENLLRDLHTLKGGARMVEIAAIGDLAHELEFLYESVSAGVLPPGSALFALLQKGHDQLAQMLDSVRAGQAPAQASALIEAIRSFTSPAPEPQAPSAPAVAEAAVASAERGQADMVKVPAEVLDTLGNLAGETSIIRSRIEQQVNDTQAALQEMEITLERMRDQLRRLDIETQARLLNRQASTEPDGLGYEEFDPLEMDRHSQLQQLSRGLFESASDLLELKETLAIRAHDAQALLGHQARVNTDLQEGLMRTRMVPFGRLLPRLQRIVRQVASELGKDVAFDIGNADGEMDRSVLERMIAPLEHMLRNAVDHGLEPTDLRLAAGKPAQGRISLNLVHEGSEVVLEMSDDGAGVPLAAVRHKAIKRGLLDPASVVSDHDVLQFILQPGFSTAAKVTQISGRGLGMDVVHEEVKQLGGSMTIDSSTGSGTTFRIRLPFSVSVNRALMVQCGEELYAVPLNTIEGIVRVPPAELEARYNAPGGRYLYGGQQYELRYLGDLLHCGKRPSLLSQTLPVPLLLVRSHDQQVAVQVDALAGSREIVVKSLGPHMLAVQGLSGATIQGDGRVVLILDVLAQIRAHQARQAHGALMSLERGALVVDAEPPRRLLVMVVDDSVTVRKVTSRLLERHGMNVVTARDGVEALAQLRDQRPDVLLLDIEMPRMDGFEVATQIRRDPDLKDLPIIMITSRTGAKHRDRAMAIGVNDYLGKPYQETRLLDSIAHWSGQHA